MSEKKWWQFWVRDESNKKDKKSNKDDSKCPKCGSKEVGCLGFVLIDNSIPGYMYECANCRHKWAAS